MVWTSTPTSWSEVRPGSTIGCLSPVIRTTRGVELPPPLSFSSVILLCFFLPTFVFIFCVSLFHVFFISLSCLFSSVVSFFAFLLLCFLHYFRLFLISHLFSHVLSFFCSSYSFPFFLNPFSFFVLFPDFLISSSSIDYLLFAFSFHSSCLNFSPFFVYCSFSLSSLQYALTHFRHRFHVQNKMKWGTNHDKLTPSQ